MARAKADGYDDLSRILMLIASCVVGGSTNTVLPAISEVFGWDVQFLRSMAGVGTVMVVFGNFVFGTVTQTKRPKTCQLYWSNDLRYIYDCIWVDEQFNSIRHFHFSSWLLPIRISILFQ